MIDIPTNLTPPTLPENPDTQQSLEFMQQMMQYSTAVNAVETAINTEGNVEKRAASAMSQNG